MNNKLKLAAFVSAFFILHSAFGQGSLTPPFGAPVPVMKSLDQVEARTPLVAGQPGVTVGAAGNITITAPGSYYLTTNLTVTAANVHGINVGTHHATIDLNGFTITMTNLANSGLIAGVNVAGINGQQVTVRNGSIIGGGTNSTGIVGVYASTGLPTVTVEHIKCHRVYLGIYLPFVLGNGDALCSVRDCSVEVAGSGGGLPSLPGGIVAHSVSGCTVRNTMGAGITGARVTDCVVEQSSVAFPGWGIYSGNAAQNGLVANCSVQTSVGSGINSGNVVNCIAKVGSGSSRAISATLATGCIAAHGAGNTAIQALMANGCYITGGTNMIFSKYNMQ